MNEHKNEITHLEKNDPLIKFLNRIIILSVKFLAVLMVFVILWQLVDVVFHLYEQLSLPFLSKFNVESTFVTLGAFLAVLIAIEIFMNIVYYLRENSIYVPLVLGTALTAVARKVIILDYKVVTDTYILSAAALILALGITYWLVTKKST